PLHRRTDPQRLVGLETPDALIPVDPAGLQNLLERGAVHRAFAKIRVQRVDERVGLGIVTDEDLLKRSAPGAEILIAATGQQEGRRLVTELLPERPKSQPEQVAQVRLERELVPADTVEGQLLLQLGPDLARAARQDVNPRAGLAECVE